MNQNEQALSQALDEIFSPESAPCMHCKQEAIDTGEPMYLCKDCRGHLSDYEQMEQNISAAAANLHRILREHPEIPPVVRGLLRAQLHEYLAAYMPKELYEEYLAEVVEVVHKEVAV